MTVGLLSSTGVALADVHPWQDQWDGRIWRVTDNPRLPSPPVRHYERASPHFFVEVEPAGKEQ